MFSLSRDRFIVAFIIAMVCLFAFEGANQAQQSRSDRSMFPVKRVEKWYERYPSKRIDLGLREGKAQQKTR